MTTGDPRAGDCPSYAVLRELAEGRSAGDVHARTRDHLASCAVCQGLFTSLSRVSSETAFAVTAPSDGAAQTASIVSSGEHVGRYRIERLLGSGAMGTVYAAHDPDIDRRVALKLIRLPSDDPERRERVLREARAMARVAHPDVITVHDVGAHGDAIFIAMELVEGGTLTEWLAARRRSPREILAVFLRAGRALAKAHEVGLVHRDFKPDNVLVSRDGAVRVTDFGLAREERSEAARSMRVNPDGVLEASGPSSLSMEGAIVGTPAYMAPEQLRGEQATAQSDIFSFCVALWEALHGARPFSGSTLFALQASIQEGKVAPPASPPGLEAARRALLLGLAAEPAVRCATMDRLLGELERSLEPAWPRRLAPPVIALAALLVAVVVAAGSRSTRPATIDRRSMVAVVAPSASGDAADTGWIGTAIAEVAWADLAVDAKVGTLSPDEVARVRRELGVSDADMTRPEVLKRAREIDGLDYVLAGSWSRRGAEAARSVRIDMRLVRAKDAKVVASADASGDAEDLAGVTLRAVDSLRERAGIGAARTGDAHALRTSLGRDSTTMQLYARGLERLRALDARAARDLLGQAVARDPDSARAHAALAQSLSALGREEAARAEASRAQELASTLPRNEALFVDELSRALSHDWGGAIEIGRALCTFYPDDLDYALRLARLEEKAGRLDDAKRTVAAIRALPAPAADDPRVDLAEMEVEASRSAYARVLELGEVAARKAIASGARGVLGRVRALQARASIETGDTERALGYGREAAALFASVGDRAAEAKITLTSAAIYADQGDLDAADRATKEARDVYLDLGADTLAAETEIDRAIILRRRDDLAGAAALGQRLLAEADATGLAPMERARVENNLAIVLYDEGDLAGARRHIEAALSIRRAIEYPRGEASSLLIQALVLAASGDADGAESASSEAMSIAARISQKSLLGDAGRERAGLALDSGRAAQAVSLAAPGCDTLHEANSTILEAPCRAVLARALASAGNLEDARAQAAAATAMLDRHFSHEGARREVRTDAAVARALADPTEGREAMADLGRVADEAARAGAVTERLRAQIALGQVLLASHRAPEGRATLDHAASEAERLGFHGLVAQARRIAGR